MIPIQISDIGEKINLRTRKQVFTATLVLPNGQEIDVQLPDQAAMNAVLSVYGEMVSTGVAAPSSPRPEPSYDAPSPDYEGGDQPELSPHMQPGEDGTFVYGQSAEEPPPPPSPPQQLAPAPQHKPQPYVGQTRRVSKPEVDERGNPISRQQARQEETQDPLDAVLGDADLAGL